MTAADDKLVVIKKDDLTKPLSDNQLILSTDGSEIRTTGKNKKKVFTPIYMRNTLLSLGVSIDSNDICSVDKNNSNVIGFIQGRGTTDVTRFKLHCLMCYSVRAEYPCMLDYQRTKPILERNWVTDYEEEQ